MRQEVEFFSFGNRSIVAETEKKTLSILLSRSFLLQLFFTHFIVSTSYVSSSGTSSAGGSWRTFEEEAPI